MSTIPYLASLGLALPGLVMLAVGLRGQWLAALTGGALLGLAVAITLVAARLEPLGSQTAVGATLIGVAVGLAAGLVGRRMAANAGREGRR